MEVTGQNAEIAAVNSRLLQGGIRELNSDRHDWQQMLFPVQPLSHLGVRPFPFLGDRTLLPLPSSACFPGFLLEAFKAGGSWEI